LSTAQLKPRPIRALQNQPVIAQLYVLILFSVHVISLLNQQIAL